MKHLGLVAGIFFALAFPSIALANVSEGSQGEHVKAVQSALGITPTGYFGPATDRAVIGYQERHGLLVDGIVGPQTDGSLFGSHRSSGVSLQKPVVSKASSGSSAKGSSGSSIPSRIAACESGGSYSAVNSSSGAGGKYQIMPSTWAAYGGSGSPQNASPAEQDAIASKIWQSQGSKAWSCK